MDGIHPRHARGRRQARLLSQPGIPDRPAAARCLVQSGPDRGNAKPRLPPMASISPQIEELEPDAALGNGGLGRLAACFMESLASLDLPACGYGIRYVNGMFRQRIKDGWQVEYPETWLAHGNPWEFERRETAYLIGFGGEVIGSETGHVRWQPAEVGARGSDRHARGGLARQAGQHLAAVERDGARSHPARCLQCRRSSRARWRARRAPNAWCAYCIPRIPRPRARNCGCARNISSASASIQDIMRRHLQYFRRHQDPAAKGGDPSERHPSRRRRRRTDAPADRSPSSSASPKPGK